MASKYERYCELLGVSPEATPEQLKRAYRKAVKKCHPDLCDGDQAEAERRFMQVTDAYRTLDDLARRKQHVQASSTTLGISPQDLAARAEEIAEARESLSRRAGLAGRIARAFQSKSSRTQVAIGTTAVIAMTALAVSGAFIYKAATTPRGPEALEPVMTVELGDGVKVTMVLMPAGKFGMGPAPGQGEPDAPLPHDVTVDKPFYISQTEVTQAQWYAVMRTRPWQGKGDVRAVPDYPASFVSRKDAEAFCRAIPVHIEGPGVRLPTEVEWEYACRAGSKGSYCFGDEPNRLGEYGWFSDNASYANEDYPHQVARKKPNAWGLYDMHGNVWELCIAAGSGLSKPGSTIIRGGSYKSAGSGCRSTSRSPFDAGGVSRDVGFRLVVPVETE